MKARETRRAGWLRRGRWLLTSAACLVGALWAWQHLAAATEEKVRSPEPSAPVHTTVVEATTFRIVLNGLGMVQATNTVTVSDVLLLIQSNT
jgi:hypothetical protein